MYYIYSTCRIINNNILLYTRRITLDNYFFLQSTRVKVMNAVLCCSRRFFFFFIFYRALRDWRFFIFWTILVLTVSRHIMYVCFVCNIVLNTVIVYIYNIFILETCFLPDSAMAIRYRFRYSNNVLYNDNYETDHRKNILKSSSNYHHHRAI